MIKFGTQKKITYFQDKADKAQQTPGPSSYTPDLSQVKPRPIAVTCATNEKRMKFQMPSTVSPSPHNYFSDESESFSRGLVSKSRKVIKRIGLAESSSSQGITFAKALRVDQFILNDNDVGPGYNIPSQFSGQASFNLISLKSSQTLVTPQSKQPKTKSGRASALKEN